MPHEPSILSLRRFNGRSRAGTPHVGTLLCPSIPAFSEGTLERLTGQATRRVDQPVVFMQMMMEAPLNLALL